MDVDGAREKKCRSGNFKNRKDKLTVNVNLDWVFEDYFRYLGIDFSTNLIEMTKYNYMNKISEIKNQINTWSRRSLTAFGRITVIKSLLVSKLNYLFLSLPDPAENQMTEINRMFYNFIWKGKPDKVSRKQLIMPYSEGGAKMINIYLHAKSLKISWIRRLLNGSIDNCLKSLLNTFLPVTLPFNPSLGNWYVNQQALSVKNSFWKDVFKAYYHVLTMYCKTKACQPLWNNEFIKVNNSPVYYKKWYDKGVRFINDLLDGNGKFLSYNDFQIKYHIRSNFIQYYGLRESIKVSLVKNEPLYLVDQPLRPDIVSLICRFKKGCSHIYTALLTECKYEQKSLINWRKTFDIEDEKWRKYCLVAFKCSSEIDLKWFQYKLLNRFLYTNDKLYKMKIIDNVKCSFCQLIPETIVHLFCECKDVVILWSQLELWILQKNDFVVKFAKENILFGYQGLHNSALNCIIIKTKQLIYNSRQQNRPPSFSKLKLSLIDYYKQEKYIAETNGNINKFDKKWFHFKHFVN